MPSSDVTTRIEAEINGTVSGQVAVGEHILQIGSVYGGVVNVAVPAERPVPTPRAAPIYLRPRPFPGLVGRATEVGAAASALRSARPVELSGPSGAGKTSFLRHLAWHAVANGFPGGVVFLPALRQPAGDLLQLLFDAFFETSVPLKPTYPELCLLFQSWQALVVLDDVDLAHEDLERVMNAAAGCTFVWAAPERRAWGEVRALPLAGLSPDDARALLESELECPLTADEVEALPALCKVTGGFPLALLQAAGQVREKGIALSEVAARLRGEAAAEPAADAAAPVSASESRLLCLLAAVGGALLHPRDAAAICGVEDLGADFETLEQRGLIQRQGERYRIRERSAAAPVAAVELRGRALAYFTAWAEQRWEAPLQIAAESDVLLMLLSQAVEAEAWVDVVRLGRRVEGALALAGRWDAWRRVVDWLHRAAEETGDERGRGWALHQLGSLALCAGNRAAAQEALTEALRVRDAMGDRAAAEITRHNLGLLVPLPDVGDGEARDAPPIGRRMGRIAAAVTVIGALVVLAGLGRSSGEGATADPGSVPVVTGLVQRPAFETASLQFGVQPVGSATPRPVRLVNPGTGTLAVGSMSVEGSDFRLADGACRTLPPNGRCALTVVFAPSAAGPRLGRLTLRDTAGNPVSEVALAGEGRVPDAPARARVDPTILQFPDQPSSAASPERALRLTNAGGRPMRVTGVRLVASGRDFRLADHGCAGAVLEPGASCAVGVAFTPRALGPVQGSVVLEHDAGGGSTRAVLRGTARPAAAAARGTLDPDRLDFATVQVGGAPRVLSAALANRGTEPLRVGRVTVLQNGSDFTARSSCPAGGVAPGASCAIQVEYAPARAGASTATLRVETNAPGSPASVPLSGTGVDRPPPPPPPPPALADAALSTERLDFGDYPFNPQGLAGVLDALLTRNPRLIIRSSGSAPLQVRSLRVLGANANAFTVSRQCSAPLAPGSSCRVAVSFQPRALGPHTAVLVIEDNTGSSPRSVRLAGTGVEARVTEVDRQPPPTPGNGSPGSTDPAGAEVRCTPLVLTWQAVTDPSAPVTYSVQYEVGATGGTLTPHTSVSRGTSLSVPPLEAGQTLQWRVSARDAAGNESRPSRWRWLACLRNNLR